MPVLTDLSEDSTIEPSAGMRMDPDKAKSIWFPKNLLSKSSKSTPTCKLPLVSIYCHWPWVFCWCSNHGRKARTQKTEWWTRFNGRLLHWRRLQWWPRPGQTGFPKLILLENRWRGENQTVKPHPYICISLHPFFFLHFLLLSGLWARVSPLWSQHPVCVDSVSVCQLHGFFCWQGYLGSNSIGSSRSKSLNFALIQCTIARRSQGARVFRPTPKGEMHRISFVRIS